jgi:membrane associated rhomboid family serine protease
LRSQAGGFGFAGGGKGTKLLLGLSLGASLLASVAVWQESGRELVMHLLYSPARVLLGELWQPLSYALLLPIQMAGGGTGGSILSFVFTFIWMWMVGGAVEQAIGPRKLFGVYFGCAAIGALLALGPTMLLGRTGELYTGPSVGLSALTMVFAQRFSDRTILLFFVLPARGPTLIAFSFAMLGLAALVAGPVQVLPEFFAMLAGLGWAYGLFAPRRAWLRFRAWRIERQLRARSSHLRVVDGGRMTKLEPPPPPPKPPKDYLH